MVSRQQSGAMRSTAKQKSSLEDFCCFSESRRAYAIDALRKESYTASTFDLLLWNLTSAGGLRDSRPADACPVTTASINYTSDALRFLIVIERKYLPYMICNGVKNLNQHCDFANFQRLKAAILPLLRISSS